MGMFKDLFFLGLLGVTPPGEAASKRRPQRPASSATRPPTRLTTDRGGGTAGGTTSHGAGEGGPRVIRGIKSGSQ